MSTLQSITWQSIIRMTAAAKRATLLSLYLRAQWS